KATTEQMLAAIARLRRSFLREILASEAAWIADRINPDELTEGGRACQAVRDLAITTEHYVGVQAASGLKYRHIVGPQTTVELQAGNSLLDVRDGRSCRPLVCVQQPETAVRLAMQFDEPHGTA